MTYPLKILRGQLWQHGAVQAHHVPLEEHHEVVVGVEAGGQALVKLLELDHLEVVEPLHLLRDLRLPPAKCGGLLGVAAPRHHAPPRRAVVRHVLGQQVGLGALALLQRGDWVRRGHRRSGEVTGGQQASYRAEVHRGEAVQLRGRGAARAVAVKEPLVMQLAPPLEAPLHSGHET